MNVDTVDLASPTLKPDIRRLLTAMMLNRTHLISQGRGREAHVVGAAIRVVWATISSPAIDIELPDSVMGDL